MSHQGHGYVDCACTYCMDVAVCCDGCGDEHDHHMCTPCLSAGCAGDYADCQREDGSETAEVDQ